MGVGFLTLGFDPKTRLEDVPIMPKERYRQAPPPLLPGLMALSVVIYGHHWQCSVRMAITKRVRVRRIMRAYMPTRGTLGHDMMFRSCTIQVTLSMLLSVSLKEALPCLHHTSPQQI